jgi:hypothetical protein
MTGRPETQFYLVQAPPFGDQSILLQMDARNDSPLLDSGCPDLVLDIGRSGEMPYQLFPVSSNRYSAEIELTISFVVTIASA